MEEERTVASRQVYSGRLISLRVDEVELANGVRTRREIVEHPGAAAVLAFTDDGQLVLVQQYRKAAQRLTLEIPAGTLGVGEDPLACAVRELKEETGFVARSFARVCSFFTAVGFCTEVLHLFAARGLQEGAQAYEDDENIGVVTMPVAEAMERVRDGTIVDSKSIVGVFWAELHQAGDIHALRLAPELGA